MEVERGSYLLEQVVLKGHCQVLVSMESDASSVDIIKVTVTSKQNIKPNSYAGAPHHENIYKFSLIDQLYHNAYTAFVLFYSNNESIGAKIALSERLGLLKHSLSETLVHYFPFAGRVNDDDLYVNCNDEGVYYVETKVDDLLSVFIGRPNYKLLQQLLPYKSSSMESSLKSYVVLVQVNVFNCGGMAISICSSHKIIDGVTFMSFVNSWAAAARGCTEQILNPNFFATSLFPQDPELPKNSYLMVLPSISKLVKCATTRRFVFDAPAIDALKAKATSANEKAPTSVVVVSSLIWKCATEASRARTGSKRTSVMSMVVNLRQRSSPPLPGSSIGNIAWITTAKSMPEDTLDVKSLASKLNSAISSINSDFINQMKGEGGSLKVKEFLKQRGDGVFSDPEADFYGISSWCKFGVYEVDFGWGSPLWFSMGITDLPFYVNLTMLFDTRSGNGIEAWVTLEEHEMAIFQKDPDILSFSTMDPSPFCHLV